MSFFFWFFAAATVLGALCAMTLRNVVHCVLAVILFFFGIAGLFVVLHAEFIAALQVLVYVGAVGVLIALAILLTRHVTGTEGQRESLTKWWAGAVTAVAVAGVLGVALWMNWPALQAAKPQTDATTVELGKQMMVQFVLPFEVVSVLLTAAMIGAIVIAMEEVFRKK
jgi:NADH-quinone oxidoreductase subunit J